VTRYLIDSNILIFYADGGDELSADIKDILFDYRNQINVPSKCVEELLYLQQSGKVSYIKRWKSPDDVIDFIINDLNFGIKYPGIEHMRTLAKMPLFRDHKDPTDRIIVAQAITENTALVSSDRKFQDYRKFGLNFVFNKRR
jgi:PIN domain nuclease of toxin-antitoxin system